MAALASAIDDRDGQLRVAIVSTPMSGHMNPVLLIGGAVKRRGHRVQVLTSECGRANFEKKCNKKGLEFVGVRTTLTMHEIMEQSNSAGEPPFARYAAQMRKPLLDALKLFKPDVVVCDAFAIAGLETADKLDVPLVMNIPGPTAVLDNFWVLPDHKRSTSIFGLDISYTPMAKPLVGSWLGVDALRQMCASFRAHIPKALVTINSFWGLERARDLPPYMVLTGPLTPPLEATVLATTHPELHEFLERATRVVYITTGSLVELQPWLVRTLYRALKRTKGVHVVWSLKKHLHSELPVKDDPDFFVHHWLPQPTLLLHPKVKAVITHCGWGGTLECIAGAKPVIALPFFADQPENAQLLVDAGMGELMAPLPAFNTDITGKSAYAVDSISEETAANVVERVLASDSYPSVAQRLQRLCREGGGADGLALRIENAAHHGVKHLHDPVQDKSIQNSTPAILYGIPTLLALVVGVGLRMFW